MRDTSPHLHINFQRGKKTQWVHSSHASNLWLRKRKSELLWNMSQKAKANGHIYQARTDLESVFED